MLRIVLMVLLILVLMAYGAGFIMWNTTVVDVIGLQWQGRVWAAEVPLAYLALAGVVVGIVFMAFAASSAWTGQRGSALEARARLELAKKKLNERTDMVRVLREDVASLRATLNAAAGPATSDATPGDKGNKRDALDAPGDDVPDDNGVDDDDVIV